MSTFSFHTLTAFSYYGMPNSYRAKHLYLHLTVLTLSLLKNPSFKPVFNRKKMYPYEEELCDSNRA